MDALIGHTGFVGGNLKQQRHFDHFYNSKNYREMINQKYNLIICAGVSAVKWKANNEPDADLDRIKELANVLSTVSAERFTLISTIDIYPDPQCGADETFDVHGLDNHAYGKNRLWFEDFCMAQFSMCHIIRLPGLFGRGIKKNVIYDLLNDNCLDMINPASSYQYYYLKNLWEDIQVALHAGLKTLNLFTEPLPTHEIVDRFFSEKAIKNNDTPEGHYDCHTVYADRWGKMGDYIYTKQEVMSQLSEFIHAYTLEKETT